MLAHTSKHQCDPTANSLGGGSPYTAGLIAGEQVEGLVTIPTYQHTTMLHHTPSHLQGVSGIGQGQLGVALQVRSQPLGGVLQGDLAAAGEHQ